jgi:succinate-semialdehyde dehydrogenase/glutarate-semialdehyde dehydrogenase
MARPVLQTLERPVIKVVSPATGEPVGEVPLADEAEVRAAIGRARDAAKVWGSIPVKERVRHLRRVLDAMLDRADEIVAVLSKECGKTNIEALASEVATLVDLGEYYARHVERILAPAACDVGLMKNKKAYKLYQPLGVVGVISPWNFPFTLAGGPALTALFAGNTVVLKPSEVTPLSGVLFGKIFQEVGGYPDIVQVVTGDGATGAHLVRGGVDKILFTGSVATGKKIMAAAAETLTPVVLELGGKDPMIVCDDADLERAAAGAVWGAFTNSGQVCMSVERVYVQEKVYDRFVDLVVARTKNIRQGLFTDPEAEVGSMTFPRQIEIVERHVADAVAKGAKVLTGGKRRADLPGLFYEPTVLVDVTHEMQIMRDETFGPILPIMKFRDDDEAVRLANDSVYGLSSSVWSRDDARARRIAEEGIQAGTSIVNDCLVNFAIPGLPFGGVKESGMGRTHGEEGLKEMSKVKAVVIDRLGLKQEPVWYPYHPKSYAVLKKALNLLFRSGLANKLKSLR